ncbi:unnamed protein product [Closterium sp. Yama58-4]|nr:unnamed protein product [Closterium sp. Yama58-4]
MGGARASSGSGRTSSRGRASAGPFSPTTIAQANASGAYGSAKAAAGAAGSATSFGHTRSRSLGGGRHRSFEEATPVLPAVARQWRVLVAEDNKVNQLVVTRMLKNLGLRFDVVDNGLQALEACLKTRYDLVLMDCHMPEMDGLEATRRIRKAEAERSCRSEGDSRSDCSDGESNERRRREGGGADATGAATVGAVTAGDGLSKSGRSNRSSGGAAVMRRSGSSKKAGSAGGLSRRNSGKGSGRFSAGENGKDGGLSEQQGPEQGLVEQQEEQAAVVIAALTASAFDFEREACFAAGMNHFLTKPIRPKDLQQLLLSLASEIAAGNVGSKSKAASECFTGYEKGSTHGRLDHVKVFGAGIEPSVKLNQQLCFNIAAEDSAGRRLDKGCSPATTTWEVLLHSADGRIRVSAPVTHAADEGNHVSCYRLLEPGEYVLSVYLTGVHAASLTGSRDEEKALRHLKFQLVGQYNVSAQPSDPVAYKEEYARLQAALPGCTAQVLEESANAGRWIDQQWFPFACNVQRITPSAARACLKGKRLLVVGDSQQWVLFSHLLSFLSSSNRCRLLQGLGDRRSSLVRLRCDKAHMQGPVPWVPGSEGQHVAVHHTYFAPTVAATYYGAEGNGFAVARIPVDLNATTPNSALLNKRKRRQDQDEPAPSTGGTTSASSSRKWSGDRSQGGVEMYDSLESRDVLDMTATDDDPRDLRTASKIREEEQERERQRAADADQIVAVFVAHSNASEPLYRDWMVNHTRRGPLANEHAPFDFVLASSGLHDLAAFDSPEEYAAALDREFVASVRFAVNGGMGGPGSAVVWLGPWAVQQSAVAPNLLHSMNHPRLSAFDAAAHSLINSWKVPFISTIPMTLSRPDLSKDGTHYSWPVSMAMLELWLCSVCPVQPTIKDC